VPTDDSLLEFVRALANRNGASDGHSETDRNIRKTLIAARSKKKQRLRASY
jgi:hypothetical protein